MEDNCDECFVQPGRLDGPLLVRVDQQPFTSDVYDAGAPCSAVFGTDPIASCNTVCGQSLGCGAFFVSCRVNGIQLGLPRQFQSPATFPPFPGFSRPFPSPSSHREEGGEGGREGGRVVMRWDPLVVPVTRRFLQEATARSIERGREWIEKGVLLLASRGEIERGKSYVAL